MSSLHDKLYEKIQLEIVKRLCKWAAGEPAGPARMVFSPTERCNLKCLYCTGILIHEDIYPKELLKRENELSKKEWVRIAREGAELGIVEWDVCGGEPLLRSDVLLAMIRTIKSINPEAVIILATNGWFLTAKVAEQLVRSGCDIIQLSIDGANAKTHDFLRGERDSFKKVTEGGRLLTSIKKKLKEEKPIIQVNTVINSKNYNELPQIALLAHSLGAEQFIANPMRVWDENLPFVEKANLELTDEQITQFHKIWEKVKEIKKLGIEVTTGFYGGGEQNKSSSLLPEEEKLKLQKTFSQESLNNFQKVFCFGPFYSLSINAIGQVGRCAAATPSRSPVNVGGKKLKELWYGSFLSSARKLMLEGKPLGDECKTCGIVTERFFILNRFSELTGKRTPKIHVHGGGRIIEINGEHEVKELWKMYKSKVMELKSMLEREKERIKMLERELADKERELADKERELADKERELADIHESISYKVGSKIGNTKIGKLIKKMIRRVI